MNYCIAPSRWAWAKLSRGAFPKAFPPALGVSIVAWALKYLEQLGYIDLENLGLAEASNVFSIFSFNLGFLLIFRTSESYQRFWTSALSVKHMATEWYEAAHQLCCFTLMSVKPEGEIKLFKHKVVRLFSLLHATALEAIAEKEDKNYPVIDLLSWDKNMLINLRKLDEEARVDTVYRWITELIVQDVGSGLLNVPAPILTRVFQEMETGMVECNVMMQIMAIPFPYPYTQATMFMIFLYALFAPLAMCLWATNPWCTFVLTFISVLAICSINMIATELEEPFGDDANDLPVHDFHAEFNMKLIRLLDPHVTSAPQLGPEAIFDHVTLAVSLGLGESSLNQISHIDSSEAKAKRTGTWRYSAAEHDDLFLVRSLFSVSSSDRASTISEQFGARLSDLTNASSSPEPEWYVSAEGSLKNVCCTPPTHSVDGKEHGKEFAQRFRQLRHLQVPSAKADSSPEMPLDEASVDDEDHDKTMEISSAAAAGSFPVAPLEKVEISEFSSMKTITWSNPQGLHDSSMKTSAKENVGRGRSETPPNPTLLSSRPIAAGSQ